MTDALIEDEFSNAVAGRLFAARTATDRAAVARLFADFFVLRFPKTRLSVRWNGDTWSFGGTPDSVRTKDVTRPLLFRGVALGEMRISLAPNVPSDDSRWNVFAEALAAALALPVAGDAGPADRSIDFAGLAHELRAPLQVCLTSAETLGRAKPGDLGAIADRIAQAVSHARAILDAERGPKGDPRAPIGTAAAELAPLVLDIDRWRAEDPAASVRVVTEVRKNVHARAAAFRVRQVLINLIKNAEEAILQSGIGGVIRVSVDEETIPGIGRRAVVIVQDDGPGVPDFIRARIFESGFTTKEKSGGAGLGLAIVKRIVEGAGGGIRVDPVSPHGTAFRTEWPIVAGDDPAAEPAKPAALRVLCIDDDPGMLQTYRMILELEGFEAVCVATAAKALERLETERFGAMLVDVRLKDMRGPEFFAALERRFPAERGRAIFATGDAQNDETRRFLNSTGNPYLIKPFQIADLRRALEIVARKAPS